MKNRIYLDTSIPSAFYDTSKPMRQLITQKWFEFETNAYELYTSVLAIEEIDRLKNEIKKENIKNIFANYQVEILEITQESFELSKQYIKNGAIPPSEPEDALHIAIATTNQIELLASWNFKHIVSINPIRKIHEINRKQNYDIIEIGSLELFGGYKYGNL